MSTVWNLSKLQLDESINLFKKGKTTNKVLKTILTIFLYVLIIAVVSVILCFAFLRFVTIGLLPSVNLFAVLLLFTQMLSFIIAICSVIKNLFYSKQNDFLMALPCSHNQVFLSKLLVLYFFELIANTLYTLPILIAYSLIATVSIGYYFMSLLFLFLLPLISLVFAGFVSIPIIYITNKLKQVPAVASVIIVLLVACLLGLYMWLIISFTKSIDFNSGQTSIITNINGIVNNIAGYAYIFEFAAECILANAGWWWRLLCIIAITLIFAVLTILFAKKCFFNLAMKNSETTTKQAKKAGKDYVESSFKSIIRKEVKTLFRAPGSVFQYFIFTILMPFIVLMYDLLLTSVTVNQTGQALIVASHVLVVAILAMLSSIVSATTISREGGNFYIAKISPSSPRTQIYAKIVFNLMFTYPALILTGVITWLFTDISLVYNILTIVAAMIISFGHIITSILLDLRKPVLDWFDANEIENVSKSTKISMVLGLVYAFIMFIIMVCFAGSVHTVIPWLILFGFVTVYSLIVFLIYHFKVNDLYKKVES